MTIQEQVRVIEGQLSNFDTLLEKLQYLSEFFDSDPTYKKEARDIVRANLGGKTLGFGHQNLNGPFNRDLHELVGDQKCTPRKDVTILVPKHAYWDGDDLVWDSQRLTFTRVTETFKTALKNMLDTMTEDYLEIHT